MGKFRRIDAQGLVDQDLFVSIGQMVLPANDMRDPHLDVVANDREIVERMAVGAEQNEVLGVGILTLLQAKYAILERRLACLSHLQPYRKGLAGRGAVSDSSFERSRYGLSRMFFSPCVARARSLIASFTFASDGAAFGVKSRYALPSASSFWAVARCFVGVVGLENDLFVVVKSEPFEAVEDRAGRFVGRACKVGVLDAKQEFAARVTSVKIVEQGRPRCTDVKITGVNRLP